MQQLKLIGIRDVCDRTHRSRAWIYSAIQRGDFPKQVSLGGRAVAWPEHEVNDWIAQKISERS